MSSKIKLILAAVVLVAIAALCWFLLLSPIRADTAVLQTTIEDEQAKLAQAQLKVDQADATRQEGKRNQARLLELAKMLPTSVELPSLLLQIQQLADQAGIQFISITPGDAEDAASGGYRIVSLDLAFSGTFFDVNDFVYRAEQMVAGPGRLLAIKALSLSVEGAGASVGSSPKLGVSMTMYAFVLGSSTAVAPVTPAPAESSTSSEAQ